MILIISDNYCTTTELVLRELINLKKAFIRVNNDDLVFINKIEISDEKVDFNLEIRQFDGIKNIEYTKIESIWYRRGKLNIQLDESISDNENYNKYLLNIKENIHDFITYMLQQ